VAELLLTSGSGVLHVKQVLKIDHGLYPWAERTFRAVVPSCATHGKVTIPEKKKKSKEEIQRLKLREAKIKPECQVPTCL
jgi:hypothetical protein